MIVISEQFLTQHLQDRYTVLRLDQVRDPKTQAVSQLYGVISAGDVSLGALPDLPLIAATHEQAVTAYRAGDWETAEEKLSALRWENPSWQSFYDTLLARIESTSRSDFTDEGWWIVDLLTD